MTQPQDKYVLRFPDGMRDRMKAAAKESGRSLNAEIVYRLEKSFEEQRSGDLEPDTREALISVLESITKGLRR